jgi:hypothetical protein
MTPELGLGGSELGVVAALEVRIGVDDQPHQTQPTLSRGRHKSVRANQVLPRVVQDTGDSTKG